MSSLVRRRRLQTRVLGDLSFSEAQPGDVGPAAGGVAGTAAPGLSDVLALPGEVGSAIISAAEGGVHTAEELAQAAGNVAQGVATQGVGSLFPSKTTIALVVVGGAVALGVTFFALYKLTQPGRELAYRASSKLADHPEALLGL